AGGIQTTGSHNPPEYNGFKLCMGTESLHGEAIQQLYRLTSGPVTPSGKRGSVRRHEVIDAYVDDVVTRVGPLKRRVKVVYDCGNGAGAVVAPKLFRRFDVVSRGLF